MSIISKNQNLDKIQKYLIAFFKINLQAFAGIRKHIIVFFPPYNLEYHLQNICWLQKLHEQHHLKPFISKNIGFCIGFKQSNLEEEENLLLHNKTQYRQAISAMSCGNKSKA